MYFRYKSEPISLLYLCDLWQPEINKDVWNNKNKFRIKRHEEIGYVLRYFRRIWFLWEIPSAGPNLFFYLSNVRSWTHNRRPILAPEKEISGLAARKEQWCRAWLKSSNIYPEIHGRRKYLYTKPISSYLIPRKQKIDWLIAEKLTRCEIPMGIARSNPVSLNRADTT